MADIIELYDLSAKEMEIFSKLSEPQLLHYYEPEEGIFIAESPRVIRLALNAGYQPVSILVEKKQLTDELISTAGDIPVYTAADDILAGITGFHLTRGALCAMRRRSLPSPQEICRGKKRIAVLEDVVNPTNVGAIIRSAAALGIEAVLLTPACSDPLYRRAARVSMGTVFQIPWTYFDTENYIDLLHSMGFKTAAMALCEDSVGIDDPALNKEEKLAIILGTEGEGLRNETIEASDYTVMIPMSHGVDSLNVAAASAVAFWQLGRHS